MKISERLKKCRISKDLTLEEVASALGIAKQTLYKYENEIITNIPSDKIEKLASIYDVTPSYIMGWEEEKVQTIAAHALGELDKDQIDEVMSFIDYIKTRKKDK